MRFLIVHHSASRNGHTTEETPGILRAFYDYHTGTKGWNDIAYNFLIDSGGGVWEGRAGSLEGPVAGDATGGNQGFTQLVCVIGDYNAAQPTGPSLRSLVSLLAWLADRYRVATAPGSEVTFVSRGSNRWPEGTTVVTPTITGHRTMSRTTCPGDHLNSYVVGELMNDVHKARGGSPVTTSAPPSATTIQETTTTASPPTSAAPTTTAASTTTSAAPTTTNTPSTSTSLSPSTSTTEVAQSSIPSTVPRTSPTSSMAPSTTIPIAAAAESDPGFPLLPVAVIGAIGVVGGIAVWRQRRMS